MPGGRYAVFRHTGNYSSLHKVYRSIYEEWFPKSKYHPQSTFSFEMYMNHPSTTETSELLTEIYIPVIRK
ncbi:GyrI-like domain-containing protein [Bacteroides thetaiotaomicron]|nr:GyrI-like domain-containing protein [Bacteroides thetaiotaomicron]MCS2349642.1 GyrI-like domain-containing protein [Bacteroides thetaiotaomicron]MCS2598557.1 GyrI-like domain-containing protein [Bacteroides thetaiotaomicron]MCS2841509.1 GyrI-like domain-containing protein [Bacteroides thetaiotaomicron]MDC2064080.1 GyrI-like domain-containing protein [Bacteroides thetaiotaomicron]MDC2080610.1 GyrI-like domain-containing protein [Bacteroides thetaiotaomicron]